MDETILLISAEYTQDAIGNQIPQENRKEIFAEIDSIQQSEFFAAGREGFRPAFRAKVFKFDYDGQEILEYQGNRYHIYRTYDLKDERTELYAERKAGI